MKAMDDVSSQLTITALGEPDPRGSYILHIAVAVDLVVVFGRFRKGKPIHVPSGEYVYVGSALGSQGSTSLPRRLIRHATRSNGQPPHQIREPLMQHLVRRQILPRNPIPQRGKKLYWNVDYLLDASDVSVSGIIMICSQLCLEGKLARWLTESPVTSILEKGLGANDDPGATHLLRVDAPPEWWSELTGHLANLTGLPHLDAV